MRNQRKAKTEHANATVAVLLTDAAAKPFFFLQIGAWIPFKKQSAFQNKSSEISKEVSWLRVSPVGPQAWRKINCVV